MTLAEFNSIFFTSPNRWDTNKMIVFTDEESMDDWISDTLDGTDNHDGEIFCALYSCMKAEVYLNEDICKSKVLNFVAVARDCVAVLIERR